MRFFKNSDVLVVLIGLLLAFSGCGDEDITGTCAGCPDDSVWSVFGSDECYTTIDECEVAESGDCVICN